MVRNENLIVREIETKVKMKMDIASFRSSCSCSMLI